MYVIQAQNVNDALQYGMQLMVSDGVELPSRVGATLEVPAPVTTIYHAPWERVLLNPIRDANPFFHFMEALWILAGRDDVKFLSEFNSQMAEYSDDGETFNSAYGFRIRQDWGFDQLETVIQTLRDDPMSRQAVLQIWDAHDLTMTDTKDKACNMSVVFRIRREALHMTVYNRSNDMIWGAYGANAVHFSMLLEYVAARLGVPMGTYTQVSNSFHAYTEGKAGGLFKRLQGNSQSSEFYNARTQLVLMADDDMGAFDRDLAKFFAAYDSSGVAEDWETNYFSDLVDPMMEAWISYKVEGPAEAAKICRNIKADDWAVGANTWLIRRLIA